MSRHDDAIAELDDNRDWSDAEVDDRPRTVTIVQSARMPKELNERLLQEAARRGISPSKLICDLVDEGLRAAADEESQRTVTIRLADLHRAIDAAVQHAA
jgi:hypothetical protein